MEMQHLLTNPKYKELWGKFYTTELARLTHGIPGVSKGTNTIVFIKCDKDPIDQRKDTTYGRVCVNYFLEKDNPNCTRFTVGRNLLNFPGDCSTPTVDMVMAKLHLNSVILTKGACYCTINLKDFYLNTPMARPEYMPMKLKDLPKGIVPLYNVADKADADGYGYIKIQKGIPPPSDGDTCTGTPRSTPQQTWLPPEPPHTRPLAPHFLTNIFHAMCGQFWHQVCWE
jgi:hypothetical protein